MIDYENTKIRKYEVFIRDIANSIVQRIDNEKLSKEGKTFLTKVKERFRFDSDRGWKFLTSCLDTIGDSEFAVVQFLNGRMENETSINTRIEYLMLYGVLSAIYIQYQAILKLCDLFKIDNKNKIKKEVDRLNIIFLRHCISAHPINYGESKVSFKIDRNSLNNKGDLSVRDEHNDATIYNIYDSINEYRLKAESLLENIGIKVIENSYRSVVDKKEELKEKLKLIKNGM